MPRPPRSRPAAAASATSSSPSSSCSSSTAATCPRCASATRSWRSQALERAGCLTDQEYRVLDDSYRFLRKTEHRLQLLFDLQTHRLPEDDEELRKLALRMGYPDGGRLAPQVAGDSLRESPTMDPRLAFLADYRDKTEPTRRILDHLLHQTFAGEAGAEPESDLILDPNPDPETIRAVLGRYPFRDVQGAYNNLVQLAQESSPFLSTRRCRHFLASIAPALLRVVADDARPRHGAASTWKRSPARSAPRRCCGSCSASTRRA